MRFSERLKQLRNERRYKQVDFAKLLGITTRQYQNYEYGKQSPDYNGLIAIADFFNVSVDYLLGRTENPEINK